MPTKKSQNPPFCQVVTHSLTLLNSFILEHQLFYFPFLFKCIRFHHVRHTQLNYHHPNLSKSKHTIFKFPHSLPPYDVILPAVTYRRHRLPLRSSPPTPTNKLHRRNPLRLFTSTPGNLLFTATATDVDSSGRSQWRKGEIGFQ